MSKVKTEGEPVLAYQSSLDSRNRVLLKEVPDGTKFLHVKHYGDGKIVVIPLRKPIRTAMPTEGAQHEGTSE